MVPLLEIRDLCTSFRKEDGGLLRAVDHVSLDLPAKTTLGVVGESGCGKSATALSILRLIQEPGRITDGKILYHGSFPGQGDGPGPGPGDPPRAAVDLLTLPEKAMRTLRGNRISMIFQEPMTSLNPVYSVGDQVSEVLRAHRDLSRRDSVREAVRLFRLVGIADPERRVHEYPHEFSGGMRQRVMIAMALACGPDLLIADEPTTALDVTIQAQILELLAGLQQQMGMSILLITHDLGVVARMCSQVVVMYAGQVVEKAGRAALFSAPRHPYTAGLLRSVPRLSSAQDAPGEGKKGHRRARLQEIPGMVPRLSELPVGCRFQDRCPLVTERCRREAPELRPLPDAAGTGDGARLLRCHHPLGHGPS
jgi:oligopeptide/dipeptide ABC transporter ATP-binding protein